MIRRSLMFAGVRDAIPIVAAYFPISVTFGVIATSSGIPWLLTCLISLCVYAGGAQFMLVSLAVAGTAPFSIIATVLLVNLRHFLYGTTLGPSVSHWRPHQKWLTAFGLTDEVFALTSSRIQLGPLSPDYQMPFALACYLSWIIGTIVGTGIGHVVPTQLSTALSFALPALFLALLMLGERAFPYLTAAVCGGGIATAATWYGWNSVGVILGAISGASLGMLAHFLQQRAPVEQPPTKDVPPTDS